jgi:3-oxoacyl-[acyl-carrier protein] reductase
MRLVHKVAIVTGGGGGIGSEIVLTLLNEGAIVVSVDKFNLSRQNKAISPNLNERFYYRTIDVTNSASVNRMVEAIFEDLHRIDILINCAGIYKTKLMVEMSDKEWDETLKVNLYGTFYFIRVVSQYMVKQKSGSIINISSIGGQMPPSNGHCHYAASKAGMIGLNRAVALELAPFGVRVNSICPGIINYTPMGENAIKNVGEKYLNRIPLGRFGEPKDIANGVIYLASEESSYITGSILGINGGVFMD